MADAEASDPGETIGSRLRKRRFAATERSSPMEDKPAEHKRARRTPTPVAMTHAETSTKTSPTTSRKRRSRVSGDIIKDTKPPELDAKPAPETTPSPPSRASTHTPTQTQTPTVPQPPENTVPESILSRHPAIGSLSLLEQFKLVLPQNPTLRLSSEEEDAIINKILKYSEQADQYERWGKTVETDGLPTMGADSQLKKDALPILSNLTTQILHVFAMYNIGDLMVVVAEPDSEAGKVR
jgi:hypothetical protein